MKNTGMIDNSLPRHIRKHSGHLRNTRRPAIFMRKPFNPSQIIVFFSTNIRLTEGWNVSVLPQNESDDARQADSAPERSRQARFRANSPPRQNPATAYY